MKKDVKQEPYEFTHVGSKTESKKQTNRLVDTANSMVVTRGAEVQ